jgi:formate dehydrogenase iron-sulfur subunit
MAAMGTFAAVGVLHYLVSGPNKVQPKDEEDAKRLAGDR